MPNFLKRFDVRVTLIYGVIAALWIILSDTLVSILFGAQSTLSTAVSIFKGLGFVVVTMLGLFLVLSAELRRRMRIENDLRREVQEHQQTEANLKTMTRLYQLLSDGNQTLIRATDEKQLLQSLCTLIVEGGGYKLAWVGYAEADTQKSIKVMASAGYEDGYLERIRLTWDDVERGKGPTGKAVRTGQINVSRFILTDPDFDLWREEAAARGYASSIALPIILNRQVIGTLNIYSAHEDAFDTTETNLLAELTNDLAYGINALRTANENGRIRKMLEQEREINPTAMVILDINARITYANMQTEKILGLPRSEIVGQFYNASQWHVTDHEGNPLTNYAEIDQKLRAKQSIFGIQNAIEVVPGKRVLLEVNLVPLFDKADQISGSLISFTDVTEFKAREKKLQESEEHFRLLFLSNPHPMWVHDIETYAFLEVNDAAVSHYGYSRDEFLSMKLMDILVPEELPDFFEAMKRPQPDLRNFNAIHHRLKNGQVIDVDITVHTLEYDGHTAGLVVAQDVTARKQAERALLDSIDSFRLLFLSNPHPMWVFDVETYAFLEVNNAAIVHYGYSWDEFMSMTVKDIRPPEDIPAFIEIMNTPRGELKRFTEMRHRLKNGEVIDVELATHQMNYAGHHAMLVVSNDITARKQAEKALRESEASLKQAQSLAHLGDWTWDTDTNIVRWSDEMYHIFGIDRENTDVDLLGVIYSAIHPDDREAVLQRNNDVIYGQKPSAMEYRVVWPDGTVRHVLAVPGELMPDTEGKIKLLSGIVQDITERKFAEKNLRESEASLKRAQTVAHVGDWTWNVATNDVLASDEIYNIFGIERSTFGGKLSDLLENNTHPDDRLRVLEALMAVNEEKRFTSLEYRIVRPDGTIRYVWAEVGGSLVDDNGNIVQLTGIMQDITAIKAAEEELRLKSAALESAANGIVITDTRGIIEWVNPAFTILTGYTIEEAKGRNQRDLINSGQHEPAFYKDLWTTILGGNVWQGELINRRKDGSIYTEEQTITPVRNASGTITHFIGIKQDITRRKQDEEALRQLNTELEARVTERTTELTHIKNRIESILNSNADPIIYSRIDGKIEQVNPAFTQAFGYRTDDIMFQPIHKLVDEKQIADLEAAFEKVVAERQVHRIEITAYKKEGEPFDASVMLSPVIENHDQLRGVVLSVHDISEHNRLLRHAMELSELKSRYVSMAAHDLRNPMAVILTSSDTLEHYYARLSEEKRLSKYVQIRSSIKVMTDILDDVLLMGQADSGKLEFKPAAMDIRLFCQMLVEEFMQSTETTIFIDFSAEGVDTPVMMDAKLLRHILANLISNAIKYSPNDSVVTFSLRGAGGQVVFKIQDCGIGIPKEDQARLFETFHRASNAHHIRGTGLGLAIVKQSVERHGGSIAFESEENKGTTFTVTLPIVPVSQK